MKSSFCFSQRVAATGDERSIETIYNRSVKRRAMQQELSSAAVKSNFNTRRREFCPSRVDVMKDCVDQDWRRKLGATRSIQHPPLPPFPSPSLRGRASDVFRSIKDRSGIKITKQPKKHLFVLFRTSSLLSITILNLLDSFGIL